MAQERLSIYTGATTCLLGAGVWSETGNLGIDTGSLVFNNFSDTDQSTSLGINGSINISDLAQSAPVLPGAVGAAINAVMIRLFLTFLLILQLALSPALAHVPRDPDNMQPVVSETGFSIRVRDLEGYDFSGLNRDPDNMQRVISETDFSIEIPGINLKRWTQQVRDTIDLVEASTVNVPDRIRGEGRQAVDQYRDLVLQGLSAQEAAQTVQDPWYREMLRSRESYVRGKKNGTLTKEEEAILQLAILQGEKVVFDDASSEFQVIVDCGTSGFSSTPCGSQSLTEFASQYDELKVRAFISAMIDNVAADLEEPGSKGTVARDKLVQAIECAIAWRMFGGTNSQQILSEVQQRIPATAEFEVYSNLLQSAAEIDVSAYNDRVRQMSLDSEGDSYFVPDFVFGSDLVDLAYIASFEPEKAAAAFAQYGAALALYSDGNGSAFSGFIQLDFYTFADQYGLGEAVRLAVTDARIEARNLQDEQLRQAIFTAADTSLNWDDRLAPIAEMAAGGIVGANLLTMMAARSGKGGVGYTGNSLLGYFGVKFPSRKKTTGASGEIRHWTDAEAGNPGGFAYGWIDPATKALRLRKVSTLFKNGNTVTIGGQRFTAKPKPSSGQSGAQIFSGASDAQVKRYFRELTGEPLPSVRNIPPSYDRATSEMKHPGGRLYTVKGFNLRDFSTSGNEAGIRWTIDVPGNVAGTFNAKGRPVKQEIKFR